MTNIAKVIVHSSRDKLPKKMAWLLKISAIESWFVEGKTDIYIDLSFSNFSSSYKVNWENKEFYLFGLGFRNRKPDGFDYPWKDIEKPIVVECGVCAAPHKALHSLGLDHERLKTLIASFVPCTPGSGLHWWLHVYLDTKSRKLRLLFDADRKRTEHLLPL